MRLIPFFSVALALTACSGDVDVAVELGRLAKDVRVAPLPPLPEAHKARAFRYEAYLLPDPFYPQARQVRLGESALRDRMLVARYASIQDIEADHRRALAQADANLKWEEERVASIEQFRARYSDADIKAAQERLAARRKERASLDAKFERYSRRFAELKGATR